MRYSIGMESKAKTSEEFDRFTALVDQVLAVPHSEIQKRQEEYQRQSKANPKRRGPKSKKNA
jgi:hypothetical protein